MHINELNSNFWLVTAEAPRQLSVFEQKENTSLNIINWGSDNLYPQELIRIVGESPILTACIETRVKYMAGDGLVASKDSDFAKRILSILNFDVWEQICYSWQYFDTASLHLKFNLNGKISGISNQETSTVRLGEPKADGTIDFAKISAAWALSKRQQKFAPKNIDLYDKIKTSEKVTAFNTQVTEDPTKLSDFQKWNGALHLVRRRRPGQLYYSNPKYAAALGWGYVDGQIQKFHSHNVDNNFTPGFILYVPFSLDGVNEKGKSKKEAFKQEVKEKWLGAENAGEPAILYGKTPESAPQIIPFASNGNDKLYLAISNLIVDHICTVTGVPPALANIQVSKGMNASKDFIINEFDKFLNTEIKPDQNKVLEAINELIKEFDGYDDTVLSVSNSRPLSYIPEAFKDDYTEDERRAANGYEPKKIEGGQNDGVL